ncbi:MAG TPA: hypothetical protein VJ802_14040 [Gemmatimonadaceae bacterium]|nr:hypothetical protein [Gemmatimonadaceae bacterium]
MTGPRPQDESSRRPIDRTYPAEAPAERGVPADRAVPADRPVPRDLDEAALGGADAVPDTPGIADHGAHAGEERRRAPRTNPGTLAQVSAGKGTTMWLSIAGIAVVLILLAIMFF